MSLAGERHCREVVALGRGAGAAGRRVDGRGGRACGVRRSGVRTARDAANDEPDLTHVGARVVDSALEDGRVALVVGQGARVRWGGVVVNAGGGSCDTVGVEVAIEVLVELGLSATAEEEPEE